MFCADYDTLRTYCDICDKLCIDGYYNNHLEKETHFNNIHKRKRLKNANMNNSS